MHGHVTLTCPYCGNPFTDYPSHAKRRVYCSRACKEAAQSCHPIRTAPCPHCGRQFRDTTGHDAQRVYCSRECYDQARRDAPFRGPLFERTCQTCGVIFTRTRAELWGKGSGTYCSQPCQHMGRRTTRIKGFPYTKVLMPSGALMSEHRWVAEQWRGYPLRPGEVVHHENEDKRDNTPENLRVMTRSEHMRLHNAWRKR
jgi:endogenous inhibitor of DNA gyrase (YacG/DUF329 family)